jgi:hypothetical protein
VAQTNNESKAGTLPDSELNPLLNPLLAANMGRWAEVYFTNPPERRAQAVAELLRELESNPQSENVAKSGKLKNDRIENQKINNEKTHERPGEFRPDFLIRGSAAEEGIEEERQRHLQELSRVCESCGHANSAGDRFCGMCGLPLHVPQTTQQDFDDHQAPRQTSWHDQSAAQYDHPDSRNEIPVAHTSAYQPETNSRYERDDRQRTNNPPSFATLDNDAPEEPGYTAPTLFNYEPEAQPQSRHRIYIGIALVIIIGLLAYKTWLGNSALWSRSTPAAVPEAVPQTASQAAPDSSAPESLTTAPATASPTASPSASTQPTSTNDADSSPAPDASSSANTSKPAGSKRSVGVARPAPHTTSPVVNALGTPGEQSGVAELSLAGKYLNGAPGTARDTQQAATWLWKSVAKQNPTATLLLSDLYLHGDGVPKSCDQARLLLDAAAKKGNAAAAERLRNLPAFGCQ